MYRGVTTGIGIGGTEGSDMLVATVDFRGFFSDALAFRRSGRFRFEIRSSIAYAFLVPSFTT